MCFLVTGTLLELSQGKKGALIGVFVDLAGNIGDDAKRKNSVVIKEVDHGGKVLHCVDFDAPLSTETEGHPKGGAYLVTQSCWSLG